MIQSTLREQGSPASISAHPAPKRRDDPVDADQLPESADRRKEDDDLSGLKMGVETEEHGPATFLDTQLLTKTERA